MIIDRIRAELDRIIDPCSAAAGAPAGLLQMGLIRELSVHQEPAGLAVRLLIGVTEPGCLMGASFAVQARHRLEHLDGVTSVHIELDHRADWQPSDIAPGYRLRLEAVRDQRRQALQARPAPTGAGRDTATGHSGGSRG